MRLLCTENATFVTPNPAVTATRPGLTRMGWLDRLVIGSTADDDPGNLAPG